MLARSLLFIVGLISLAWIAYSSYEMLSQENKFNPTYLFGEADGEILIINNPGDKDALLQLSPSTESNKEIITALSTEKDFSLFVSKNRNHLLIETRELLTEEGIKKLFNNHSAITQLTASSFKWKNYTAHYYKNHCYITEQEFNRYEPQYKAFVYDKNSNGSKITFTNTTFSVTDIYVKESGVIDYKLRTKDQVVGKKLDDAKLFSSIISSRISSYEFYEVDYLRNNDSSFLNSPLNNWVKNGLVKVKLDGKEALITDYLEGQNPINVMYETIRQEPENYENAFFEAHPKMDLINTVNGFYMYLLDDYVVLSSDKATCEKLLGDYKLGNTIAHSPDKMFALYSLLPKKVNYRMSDGSIKQASSVYKNTLLTSTVSNPTMILNEPSIQKTIALDVGEAIEGFHLAHDNSIFVVTKSNSIQLFDNGTKKWSKQLDAKIMGEPEIIDLFDNDKKQLLISTDKEIHLFDINGNEVSGFPIQLNENRSSQATSFYRWKGSGYFIVPIENGKLIQFDTKGREITLFQSKLRSIELKPAIWVSANKLFIGVYADNKFDMINLSNGKSLRTFDAPNTTHFAQLPNELILLGMDGGTLITYNQKGTMSRVETDITGKIVQVYQQSKNPTIIVQSKNTVRLFNSKGIEWSTIRIGFNEIDDLQLHELSNGNLILSVVDGLENNVYLYGTNGQKWKQKSWEGSHKVGLIQSEPKGFSLITIVDKMVVKYKEN